MIKYKIDVYEELRKAGVNTTIAKNTGIFSQSVMQKFKNKDTSITIDCLNKLCTMLCLQVSDILEYVPEISDSERRENVMKETALDSFLKVKVEDWTYEYAAQAIGGAVMRAYYTSYERSNRVILESRPLSKLIESIADGFNKDKTYNDIYELCTKMTYFLKVLNENGDDNVIDYYIHAQNWVLSYRDVVIDKGFYYNYMLGWTCDIFRHLNDKSNYQTKAELEV